MGNFLHKRQEMKLINKFFFIAQDNIQKKNIKMHQKKHQTLKILKNTISKIKKLITILAASGSF